jgi:4-hydroxy-3-polyprenylbenzoate decarboxylase
MLQATECGAIVAPPVPAFYLRPRDTSDIVDQIARRSLDLLALTETPLAASWSGLA